MGCSIFQIEDGVHFFVVIEIATYATNILVLIIEMIMPSIIYKWRVWRARAINNGNDDRVARQPALQPNLPPQPA